ncbi:MAG: contractile injection system protein, VgrG/Pvc8 family [Bacteroidia bacterium]
MSSNNGRIIESEAVVKGCRDFVLLSDGKEVDATVQVVSMSVSKKVNKVSTARIVVKDGSTCEESFSVSDGDYFTPGKKIEIQAGRGGTSVVVFKGIVIKIKVKAGPSGAQLTVECKDECLKMAIGRKNNYFKDKTDDEIIKAVLGKYGLVGKLDKSSVKHSQITQSNASDWEFILSRASSNGMLVVPDDGKINLIKPDDSVEPAISLVHGSTVVEFEAELDAKNQYPKVKATASGADVSSSSSPLQELGNIAGEALSQVLGLESFELRHGAEMPKQELQAWADSTMLKSRLAKVKGRAKFKGFGAVKPGDVVGLGGVGARFGGKAFVASTQQVFESNSWTTTAEFGLEQKDWGGGGGGAAGGDGGGSGLLGKLLDQAAELLQSAKGLRTAKVLGLKGADVMVDIPIIGPVSKGFPAKHAVLDAGASRGTYFPPKL